MKFLIQTALIAFMAILSSVAFAHNDEYLDTLQAPHGGQLRMAGPYHLELVINSIDGDANNQEIVVYVTDHAGQPIPANGATAKAIVAANNTKIAVALKPESKNTLKGIGQFQRDAQLVVVVLFTSKEGKTEQAKFSPLKKKSQ